MDKFLTYINKHYRVLKDEELFKLLFRFKIKKLEGITFIKYKGWQEQVLKGGQIRYWNPLIKDKRSMISGSEWKKLNVADKPIDIEREKTKHRFLRDTDEQQT